VSWNYSGDPSNSFRDYIRFLIKDTNQASQEFSNEELQFMVAQYNGAPYATVNANFLSSNFQSGNAYGVAIILVERLMVKYSRFADKRVGDLSISYSQILKGYESLLLDLRNRVTLEAAAPFMGGDTFTSKQVDTSQPDRVQPNFRIGQQDITQPLTDLPGDNTGFGGGH
jgi:hypothetical protein